MLTMATSNYAKGGTAESAAGPVKAGIPGGNIFDSMDNGRKLSIIAFIILLVVFSFSCYVYSRLGLDFGSVANVMNYTVTIANILSPGTLMFFVVISLSMARAAFASRGLGTVEAVALSIAATALPAIVLGMVFPSSFFPFIAFSIGMIGTAFFTSRMKQDANAIGDAWSITGKAVFVFIIASVILTFVVVSDNNAIYYDQLTSGIIGAAPMLMPSVEGALANGIAGMNITQSQVESIVAPRDTVWAQLNSSVPGFSSLNASEQDQMVNATYANLITEFTSIKTNFANSLEKESKNPPTALSADQVASVKATLDQPNYKWLSDYFPIFMALLVWSILGIVTFIVRIIAAILTFLAFNLKKAALEGDQATE